MQLLQHFKELTVRPKNAKELKGLILQLAIQGKLTGKWREENKDIEPASDLLNRIQKEKEKLFKDKKIRKEKPYAEIEKNKFSKKNPLSWDCNYIRDISSVVTCGMASTPKYTETGRIFLSAKNVKPFTFKPEKHKFVSEDTYQKIIKNSKPEKGDVLLTRVGAGIGEACVIDQDIDFAFYVSLTLIKPMIGIDSNYMLYWLSSKDGITKVVDNIYGKGVSQGNLNVNQVRQFVMPIPPLKEQKEIVKVVKTLFKEVEQLEQLTVERIGLKENFVTSALNQLNTNNTKQEWTFLQDHFNSFFNETANIKKLRETVLQLAVQGKLTADWRANNPDIEDASVLLKRIQKEKAQLMKDKKIKKEKALPKITDEEIANELPDGWVFTRLGSYTHNFGQKKPDKNFEYIDVASIDNHIGIIKTDLNIVSPEEAPSRARKIVEKGCVIYSTVRPYLLNIACVDREFENEAIASTAFSILNPILGCSPSYLYYLLRSPYFVDYVEAFSKGVAYPAINDKNLLNAPIPIPPIEEQKAIVKKVNALMGLCDKLEQEVQQSQEHSAQLMQSCLTEVFEAESITTI